MTRVDRICALLLAPMVAFALVSLSENQTLDYDPFYWALGCMIAVMAVLGIIPPVRRYWLNYLRTSMRYPPGPVSFAIIAGFLTMGVALILVGLLAAVALDSNAWWDPSPSEEHVAEVLTLDSSSGRTGTSYYAVVRSWRDGRNEEKLKIPEDLYKTLAPKSRLRVLIGRGRWNWSYVRDAQRP